MKAGLSLIVCVLDRSGSMGTLREEAINGFNTFLAEQKKLPGEARLTMVQFDDHYEKPVDNLPIEHVSDLNRDTFVPRGMTALYDAVGRTIDETGRQLDNTPDDDKPEAIIFAILTDGQENASKEYDHARVSEMIKHQQDSYGWNFLFLGANMDAVTVATAMNIPAANAATYQATARGMSTAYRSLNESTSSFRAGNNLSGGGSIVPDDDEEDGKTVSKKRNALHPSQPKRYG